MHVRIEEIEKLVQCDEGARGILDFLPPAGSLELAANSLIGSKSVAIITGFPCMIDYKIPTETDGPLGSLAIARTLLHLGKKVIILTDECNEEVLLACGAASGLMVANSSSNILRMESFPATANMEEDDFNRLLRIQESVDLVIAVERSGPNSEGKYCTMRF